MENKAGIMNISYVAKTVDSLDPITIRELKIIKMTVEYRYPFLNV